MKTPIEKSIRLSCAAMILAAAALSPDPARATEFPLGGARGTAILPILPTPLPPRPVPQNDDVIKRAVWEQLETIEKRSRLRGRDYFSKHPASPKIEAVFRVPAPSDHWYPRLRPVRSWRVIYHPSKGEKQPPLESLEIPLDRNFYDLLSLEADEVYGPGYFKDQEERAERLALFLAPRAAADLEAARVMDEQELPNGVWVDALEELRLLWEIEALRAQISRHEAMLRDPGFKILPSEQAYLAGRFGGSGVEAVLSPGEALFSELAAQDWRKLRKEAGRAAPMLRLSGADSNEQIRGKNLEGVQAALRAFEAELQAFRGRPLNKDAERAVWTLQRRVRNAEAAEACLGPGMGRLREAVRREREGVKSLSGMPDSAKDLFLLHVTLVQAAAAAAEFDLEGMESLLRNAEAAARRAGLNYDIGAVRQSLRNKYITVAQGLELLAASADAEAKFQVLVILRTFGDMGPQAKEAIPALEDILLNPKWIAIWREPEIPRAAARALGKMGPKTTPALAKGPGVSGVRPTIQNMLADKGPRAIPP